MDISAEQTVKIVVEAEYGIENYYALRDGGEQLIYNCLECSQPTYILSDNTNVCYFCDEGISGECSMCSTELTVANQSVNDPSMCEYCDYQWDKVMRE